MKLSTWQNGLNKGIQNALKLYTDALLLIKNNSYGHACFFFITAFEEIGAVYYILDHFDTPQPKELDNFLNHHKKMALTSFKMTLFVTTDLQIFYEYLKIRKRQIISKNKEKVKKDTLKLGSELKKRNSLWYIRNHSLYLKLNESKSQFTSPEEISRDITINLQTLVKFVLTIARVDRDMAFKFGVDTEEMKKSELELVNSIINLFKLLKILQEGAIDKLVEFQGIDSSKKDFFTKLLLNRKMVNIDKNPDIIRKIIISLFSDISLFMDKLLKKEENKQQFDFYLKRMTQYDRKLAFFYKDFFRLLNHIAKGKFKLESFPKIFQSNLKKK